MPLSDVITTCPWPRMPWSQTGREFVDAGLHHPLRLVVVERVLARRGSIHATSASAAASASRDAVELEAHEVVQSAPVRRDAASAPSARSAAAVAVAVAVREQQRRRRRPCRRRCASRSGSACRRARRARSTAARRLLERRAASSRPCGRGSSPPEIGQTISPPAPPMRARAESGESSRELDEVGARACRRRTVRRRVDPAKSLREDPAGPPRARASSRRRARSGAAARPWRPALEAQPAERARRTARRRRRRGSRSAARA